MTAIDLRPGQLYAKFLRCPYAHAKVVSIDISAAEKMPGVNVGLLDGQLAWRQHDGGHTDGPNWKYFIPWADRQLKHTPPKS